MSNPTLPDQNQNTQDKHKIALQAALESLGSQLKLMGPGADVPIFGEGFARVESKSRFCQIMIIAREFHIDFWDQGVYLVNAGTSDVNELAKAIHSWIDLNCNLAALNMFSFINVPSTSYAHENGEEVEQKWQSLLEDIPKMFPELSEFAKEAYQRPRLRQLFPYTSHNTFRLSRCTGYPYTGDLPIVIPAKDNRYEVITRDGKALGSGNANWAANTVEANLPENCGPAVVGTAEDLEK
jgi:hypothetical protein